MSFDVGERVAKGILKQYFLMVLWDVEVQSRRQEMVMCWGG